MIFPTLSTSLLGFASLAVAVPYLTSRFQNEVAVRGVSPPAARGLTWTPRRDIPQRNNDNNNNNAVTDITITQFVDTQVSSSQRNSDVELVQLIQEKIVVIDNSQRDRDNIRRNTFKNRNNNVNTVVIVVTQVIDQRNSNNVNTRYWTRQIQSNEDIKEQVLVVVSDSNQLTIGTPTGSGSALPTGSSQSFGTYDPNAQASVNNSSSSQILPSGAGAPSWSNAQQSQDPADIVLDNPSRALFVEFVDEESSSDSAIVVSASQ